MRIIFIETLHCRPGWGIRDSNCSFHNIVLRENTGHGGNALIHELIIISIIIVWRGPLSCCVVCVMVSNKHNNNQTMDARV